MNNPMSEDQTPEIDGEDYPLLGLIRSLLRDEIALPVWINFPDSRFKITEENKEGVLQGLMIAADINALEP